MIRMKRTMITVAAYLVLATPALALDYDCSPLTGACVPASPPSSVPPPIVYAPQRVWPRTCPLDGPGAWDCNRSHERRDHHDR
jgi:hypothetical protein